MLKSQLRLEKQVKKKITVKIENKKLPFEIGLVFVNAMKYRLSLLQSLKKLDMLFVEKLVKQISLFANNFSRTYSHTMYRKKNSVYKSSSYSTF